MGPEGDSEGEDGGAGVAAAEEKGRSERWLRRRRSDKEERE